MFSMNKISAVLVVAALMLALGRAINQILSAQGTNRLYKIRR